MSDRKPPVVLSAGCLKVAQGLPPVATYSGSRSVVASPASSSGYGAAPSARVPFQGLTVCVTGLSKDARKQVQEATEWMGGQYSPDLHPQCTHLVVQSFAGRKFEHALKHGLRRGLFVVTLAWFLNCVKQNERLDESLYSVRTLVNPGIPFEEFAHRITHTSGEQFCLPLATHEEGKSLSLAVRQVSQGSSKDLVKQGAGVFSGMCFYIDPDVSSEFRPKVVEAAAKEGASFVDHWFIGCEATHVVCEGSLLMKYIGFNTNLVTPLWVMKTVRERHLQRVVQLSADLARHVFVLLDVNQNGRIFENTDKVHGRKVLALCGPGHEQDLEAQIQERDEKMIAAKAGVRRRRGPGMQPCRTIPRPITPSILLESICWSITEPPSTARFFTDSSGSTLLANESEFDMSKRVPILFDAREDEVDQQMRTGNSDGEVYTRPMNDSEKKELVFKGSFLTILFPIDRFAEIGPSSRNFFSEKGFERCQILDLIHAFYQEYISADEVDVAIHSDSRHADRLRTVYSRKDTIELGYAPIRRYEFLGSRKSLEGLKRIGRDYTGQVYELWLGA